jgi:hypothetical protein
VQRSPAPLIQVNCSGKAQGRPDQAMDSAWLLSLRSHRRLDQTPILTLCRVPAAVCMSDGLGNVWAARPRFPRLLTADNRTFVERRMITHPPDNRVRNKARITTGQQQISSRASLTFWLDMRRKALTERSIAAHCSEPSNDCHHHRAQTGIVISANEIPRLRGHGRT